MSACAEQVWVEACRVEDIPQDEGRLVRVNGVALALFSIDGEIFALDDACPHSKTASLSQGYVENGVVECPLHQACFEIRTGKVTAPPAETDVQTYPARVEAGVVFIGLQALDG